MKTIHIEGMMCQHCVAHVRKALEPLDPNVVVSLESKTAVVRADVDDAAARQAIADAGYEVTAID